MLIFTIFNEMYGVMLHFGIDISKPYPMNRGWITLKKIACTPPYIFDICYYKKTRNTNPIRNSINYSSIKKNELVMLILFTIDL